MSSLLPLGDKPHKEEGFKRLRSKLGKIKMYGLIIAKDSLVAQTGKNLPVMWET